MQKEHPRLQPEIDGGTLADVAARLISAYAELMNHGSGMTPHRRAALERIKALILDGLPDRDAAVILFGSCATGEADRASDIDVAVLPRQDLDRRILGELKEKLEESTIPYHVDLVDLSRAAPEFRRRVEEEGIWWRR